MKLKNVPPTNFKSSIIFATTILLSGLLLGSQKNLKFLSNAFFADITATISTDKKSVCVNETATITLEGFGGVAPYIFTYSLNTIEEPTIDSGSDNKATINFSESNAGNYIFKH